MYNESEQKFCGRMNTYSSVLSNNLFLSQCNPHWGTLSYLSYVILVHTHDPLRPLNPSTPQVTDRANDKRNDCQKRRNTVPSRSDTTDLWINVSLHVSNTFIWT